MPVPSNTGSASGCHLAGGIGDDDRRGQVGAIELAAIVGWDYPPTHNREPYDTQLSDTISTDPSVEPMPLSSTEEEEE